MEQTEKMLASGSITKLMARFAIPSVTAMLVNALYNIIDQIFIGQAVGYMGIGAANVVLLITIITLALSLWIGDGCAAYFSLQLGEGKKENAAKGFGNALLMISIVSILVCFLTLCFLEPIVRLLGSTDLILPLAMDYGYIIVCGLPFIMISTSMNAVVRADGSPRYAMTAMILGAVINACLDPVFLFVFDMGIQGAALSTLIAQIITFLITVAYLKKFQCIQLKKSIFLWNPSTALSILKLGISSFIDQIAFSFVMVVNNNLIIHYGAATIYGSEIPLTAYGISMKVQEILFTLILGIAIGMQPIVGYNYGAGNYKRVRQAYQTAVIVGTLLSIAAVILFTCFPHVILSLFTSGEQILYEQFAVKFFQTYFLLYIFFGFQTITGVFFQAIGKPSSAALISFSYQLLFKVVSAVMLSLVMGLDGVLWSGPLSDALAFVLCLVLIVLEMKRLHKKERIHVGDKPISYMKEES